MKELGFQPSKARFALEREKRLKLVERNLSFGNTYLDRVLRGILPDDLVLIGAMAGVGKTEIASSIASFNALQGKRVHLFALEAARDEIERRAKYKFLTIKYHADSNPIRKIVPNYLDWYYGDYEDVFAKYESDLEATLAQHWNLQTYYRDGEFGIKQFEQIMLALNNHTDLIVVDHLHYFDTDDENENKAFTEIMKKIRDLALLNEVPVVLVAHLRKPDERTAELVPTLDAFQGTSNIGKIATKAIVLAPGEMVEPSRFETFVRAVKCRIDGSRARFVGKVIFDTTCNEYESKLEAGRLSKDGQEFIAFSAGDNIPDWLKKGKADE